MILFFTSGTVSYPKMVQHAALLRARPRRDRALLARPAAGRPALDRDRHRLGEGGLGRAVRAVARARDASSRSRSASPTPTRSSAILAARTASRRSARRRRSTGCSSRATSAPHDLSHAAPLHERRRAAEPRGHPRLEGRHRRADRLRRLRPVRDDAARRQLPRRCRCGRARWARPVPGWDVDGRSTTTADARRRRRGRQHRRALDARPPGRPVPTATTSDADANAKSLPRRLVLHRRQGRRDEDGYLWFEGRDDDVITSSRLPDRPVRGRVARWSSTRRSSRRRWSARTTPSAPRSSSRLRHPRAGPRGRRRARRRAAGPRQAAHRAVQVPARDPLRRRAAEDGQRQDPPHRAARAAQRDGLSVSGPASAGGASRGTTAGPPARPRSGRPARRARRRRRAPRSAHARRTR